MCVDAPISQKIYFKFLKNLGNKYVGVHHIIVHSSTYMGKKLWPMSRIHFLFARHFLCFYKGHKKCILSSKFLWVHIECLDAHHVIFSKSLTF
jgi:hypothetical protein